jgi:hypothetical protein
VAAQPGLTDREITDILRGPNEQQQPINATCRRLASDGKIRRLRRPDSKIGNYPPLTNIQESDPPPDEPTMDDTGEKEITEHGITEDDIKHQLVTWLTSQGWQPSVRWGHAHGPDVEATLGSQRWVIEAKGCGSRSPMRVNFFLAVLGELLQRMDDPQCKYSIALPDLAQFHGLWDRLPPLAKARTQITALFVDRNGSVTEVK